MTKRYRLFVIMAIAGLLLLYIPGFAASAQSDVRLASLRIGLWPEYDRPSLLIIYWGELAPDTQYPVTVNLRMPAEIVAPFVVAAQTSLESNVVEVPYEARVEGDWRIISFEANGPRFQFEYYNAIEFDGSRRMALFRWPGDYAVDALSVEFQQPPGASNLAISPALNSSQVSEQDGLLYYQGQFGSVEASQTLEVTVSYDRSQDALTADLLAPPESPVGAQSGGALATPTRTGSADLNIVLMVVVAVVFFLLGAAAMRVAINLQELNRRTKGRR
ncbi:MAG: hypothetical protein Kow0077_09450 [Anaerolineae bacterium]